MAPEVDFAVLEHRFARHGRDYIVFIEDSGANPRRHELVFTHCVRADCKTRVRDDDWPKSWTDEFADYEKWIAAKEPGGYVWGTNWSLADPGIRAIHGSAEAAEWSRRLGRQTFEATLETDRFFLRLIFHSLHWRKTSENAETISRVIIPLKRTE